FTRCAIDSHPVTRGVEKSLTVPVDLLYTEASNCSLPEALVIFWAPKDGLNVSCGACWSHKQGRAFSFSPARVPNLAIQASNKSLRTLLSGAMVLTNEQPAAGIPISLGRPDRSGPCCMAIAAS